MAEERLNLLGVGDVCVNRDNPDSIFALVASRIKEADVAFCQLEINFSERGSILPQARWPLRAHPRNAQAIKNAGFHVVSFAGNHCMDWGVDAFFDTLDTLKKLGLIAAGVGKNIDEARKPVIIEKKGIKVAFLAYCSILPYGYWALPERPGCAPLRGLTLYEQIEVDQPGTPARIYSFALPEDLQAMEEDVRKAKKEADAVVVSVHFGIHFIPAQLAMYQREIAYAAVDSGADLILGHHAHILKGIEVYKGKVIFHSLCNFAFDLVIPDWAWENPRIKELRALHPGWERDPDSTYHFPLDSKKTIIAKALISKQGIERVSFLPVMVNKYSQPQIVPRQDSRAREVYEYVEWLCRDQQLPTRFYGEGDEIIIET